MYLKKTTKVTTRQHLSLQFSLTTKITQTKIKMYLKKLVK